MAYQADTCTFLRRVVAEVEDQAGELFRPVEFIVTNLTLRSQSVVLEQARKRGALDQEGTQATQWTRLSCHRFCTNDVRVLLSVLASNLGNLWRQLVSQVDTWPLISLQQRLINTARYLVNEVRESASSSASTRTAAARPGASYAAAYARASMNGDVSHGRSTRIEGVEERGRILWTTDSRRSD